MPPIPPKEEFIEDTTWSVAPLLDASWKVFLLSFSFPVLVAAAAFVMRNWETFVALLLSSKLFLEVIVELFANFVLDFDLL